jgi:hypothetical protein
MPHPTPVQIAYGSATVIVTTFVLLLVAPTESALAVALVALFSLALGTVAGVAAQARRDARRAWAARPPAPEPDPAARAAADALERPEVRV